MGYVYYSCPPIEVPLGRFYAPDFTFPPKNLVFILKTHPNVGGYEMGFYFTLSANTTKTFRRCTA
jgi:hypothetical protein